MSDATNRAVATVTDAMVIAGIEMMHDPDMNQYYTNKKKQLEQSIRRKEYRINAIKRVINSELQKPETRTGDPQYFMTLVRFANIPDAMFIDCLETLPYVGSRSVDSPVWDMP